MVVNIQVVDKHTSKYWKNVQVNNNVRSIYTRRKIYEKAKILGLYIQMTKHIFSTNQFIHLLKQFRYEARKQNYSIESKYLLAIEKY